MKKIILLCSMLLQTLTFAGTSTNNTKSSATLSATCSISSENVSFGNLLLPVSSQSATGTMNVLCNKGASYTISMEYGGVYGVGVNGNLPLTGYKIYNGYAECYYSGLINGTTYTATDYTTNRCDNSYKYSTSYNYGLMKGAAKGDNIAYFIQVPNEPTKVWNSGNYSYSAVGIGISQSIPVKATLIPNKTTSNFPIPDMYIDIATATISF